MSNSFRFTFHIPLLLVIIIGNHFTSVTLLTPLNDPIQQIDILNAFSGCNIRLINFRGLNIDFRIVKEPILLLRYLSYCKQDVLFPFELGSAYPSLKSQTSHVCHSANRMIAKLPAKQVATNYVAQTLTEAFQLKSKNKICEANVYLHPPTERDSLQMYTNYDFNDGETIFKDPISIIFKISLATQKWKRDYLNTVPTISLLICNLTADSICGNESDIKKWIAGVSQDYGMSRVSATVLIWEYSSLSLKTLCPYCDPCDSLKVVPFHTNTIPTSENELRSILQESQQMNPDPHSIRVVLSRTRRQYGNIKNRRALLKHIQMYPVEEDSIFLYFSADTHLTSLLLPNSVNITFSSDYGRFAYRWKNVIVDACSPTKPITSHPVFRPMIWRHASKSRILFQESRLITYVEQFRFVSCHKKQMHWTNQLTELISPFDSATWSLILTICIIVSWIVKISRNSKSCSGNPNLFDITFSMFWSILDQSSSLFGSTGKTKASRYFCLFFVPITWLYLSTLYKGDNVTRLTADPPLIQFDTFKMLEEYQFNIYSPRINLETFGNAKYYNIKELDWLLKQHGSVVTHEALPMVSELWYELMKGLRPQKTSKLGLNYLKAEISKQLWKYINNSAMLPEYGQKDHENISTILNFHMNSCNKSAIILKRQKAIRLHTILAQMGKPTFFGKDKIMQRFWGYKFAGYFPPKFIFRARYLFESGLFEWWQKHFDYSFTLKLNVHEKRLMALYNQNMTSRNSGSKTAVAILTLMPGVGLLVAFIIFICTEICFRKELQKKDLDGFISCLSKAISLLQHIQDSVLKLHAELENTFSINVQPKIQANGLY